MRVLLVSGSFPPMACGVGDYTRSLAASLSECAGIEVAVLTSAEADGRREGAPYQVFPVVRRWDRAEFAEVEAIVRSFRPDIVHVQYPTLGYRGELAALLPMMLLRLGVRVVQTWHEYFPLYFPVRIGLLWRVLGLGWPAGDVIVVRPGYARHVRWWYRLLNWRKRLHFIPNASTIPAVALTERERAAVRERYAPPGRALLAFFGFFFEHKGIDDLLAIVEPQRHHLVMVGAIQESDPYQAALARRLRREPYRGSVTTTGFLPPLEVARILAAADAVVLPFRHGGGSWNTTIQAAILQGTFVLTTSAETPGFDAERNLCWVRPGDIAQLKVALEQHLGRRRAAPSPDATWAKIAGRHLEIYRDNLS